MRRWTRLLALACMLGAGPIGTAAAADPQFTLVIENHRFQPEELTVPAGRAFEIVVDNRDATPEEFESLDLRREKVIPGGTSARIRIGPLEPGTYGFVGEFHEDTAKGRIVAQ